MTLDDQIRKNQEEREARHAAVMAAHRERVRTTPEEFAALCDWLEHTPWCRAYDGSSCNCGLNEHKERMYAWFREHGATP